MGYSHFMSENKTENLILRPPIVVVMGHVDHGKTTLLDYLRKTSVALREVGGITQSIGAYEIIHPSPSLGQVGAIGKKITFIDTPGHEAFSKMRTRGARAADLAILVVAADDGVKPQTKEVIEILKQTKTPFVVAINKIDKSNADPERVKQELIQAGVLLEGFGGTVSWQGISAKKGDGVNELLDLILLAAEIEGLTYNPEIPASGIVIESKMDSRRGLTVMAIVENGILKIGDSISTKTASGKVKILENFLGERVEELAPSSPALILGFDSLPEVGEKWQVGGIKPDIRTKSSQVNGAVIPAVSNVGALANIFLKADMAGSLEAISEIIEAVPDVKIVSESIGEITDGDVKNAQGLGAIIVGFKTKIAKPAENLAKSNEVTIITSDIIYELIRKLEENIAILRSPGPKGILVILATFSRKGKRQVVGGRVESGTIRNNIPIKIVRSEEIGLGRITNLQKDKKDTNQVNGGEECGIMVESEIEIKVGDSIIYPSSF